MIKHFTFFVVLILFSGLGWSQTQNDTIFNYLSSTPITVDGQANEDCWKNAEWHAIDQVWIPYAASMKEGDFEGRFKVSWDENYLYVLVEVVDDMLSDDRSNPYDGWWDDDCLEIFIDENRSKGDHRLNCNAFAYHVSLTFDALDLNASNKGINYKENIEVDMDTIAENTYLWEFAIKNYHASFNINNPEASRVYLEPNKKMGFTIAYCDNDETNSRENFIGSMEMIKSQYNDMYKNADHFGLMLLVDPNATSTIQENKLSEIKIYPIPADNYITIKMDEIFQSDGRVSILNIAGQIVKDEILKSNTHTINIVSLDDGMYIVKVTQGNKSFSQKIIKQ